MRAAGGRGRGGRVACACLLAGLLAGCANTGTSPAKPEGLGPRSLVKTDIDRVLEAHQREIFGSLKVLAEKLYRRNPHEWRERGRQPSLEAALARLFDTDHRWVLPELGELRDVDALQLAFRQDYGGDRVAAFIVGLGSMVQAAFNDRTEIYITDELDPQRLYNCARNVEIAAWKLANTRGADGRLLLLSNDTGGADGEPPNLSFEREIGKLIARLDMASLIVADKNNRLVVRVVQTVATAVFLPVH